MSFERWRTISGLELRSTLKGPLFWVLVASLALATASMNPAALIPSGDPSIGGAKPFVNSQYAMAQIFALSATLLYSFFAAIIAGLSIIRDDESKISELLHSTPLTAAEYVLGKFGGVMASLGVALSLQVLFAMIFFQFLPVDNPEEVRGAFRLANFVVPALAFAAPLVWLCAGLAFAVGERTRKPLLVVSVPIALFLANVFFLWQWTPSWLDPAVDRLLMVLDSSSLRWLAQTQFRVDRGVEFYNTQPVAFNGTFLLNRALAVLVPLVAIVASIPHCRAVISGAQPAWGWLRRRVVKPAPDDTGSITAPRIAALGMHSSPPSFLASTLQLARSELRELRAHPGLYLFVPLVMLTVWEFAASATGALDAPVLMTAGEMAVGALTRITVTICLLLLFYTVESLMRDKTTRFDSILYALPFRTAALLLAKNVTNAVVAAVIVLACTVTGMTFLALQPTGRVEVWPFILVWGLIVPPTLFVWSAFVTAVLSIVRERYSTYAVGLTALLLSAYHHTRDSMSWVYNWNLWGTLRWSDMGTFDLNGRALLLNRILTLAVGILFAAVAVRLFGRTERDPLRNMERLWPSRVLGQALRLAPFALLPIVVASFLAVEIRDGFQGQAARSRAKDYRRQNLATWQDFVPPTLRHVDLAVDLDPERRSMDVEGTYVMTNRSNAAMSRLPFTVGQAFRDVSWTLDGSAVDSEDRSGLHLLDPTRPLMPGDGIRVGFTYSAVFPDGPTKNGGGMGEFILPSGVALHTMSRNFVPLPGFDDDVGRDAADRTDPREYADDFWKAELEPVGGIAEPFTARVEIRVPGEYTVNAVGVKTADTLGDGIRTVVWESDYPVKVLNLVAGRWEVRRQDGTAVFYHPGHPYNIDEISDTLAAARRRFSEWFHPYPWQELKLSQFPNQVSNAQGFPTNISFSEGIGFLTKSDARAPLAFVVTAHEASHQWWGNLITPGEGPGADVLIEGMAHYSTLLLQESENGLRGRMEFAKRMEQSYSSRRRVDGERPLVKTGDGSRPGDETVIYDKGAWVMWMLQNHLGREEMLAGLRKFIRHYIADKDHPALHDLIETLRPRATDPAAFQAFVDQWFFGVVTPDYRITDATLEGSETDWIVSATVENVGTGTAIVELAATRGERFVDDSESPSPEYSDARTSLLLEPGVARRVSWVVPFEPERLVVDPDVRVLQLNRTLAVTDRFQRPTRAGRTAP